MLFLTVWFVDIKHHARVCICYKSKPAPDVIGDQSDAVTQNAWFHCTLCAAISGEISILIQTGAESWGRFYIGYFYIGLLPDQVTKNDFIFI